MPLTHVRIVLVEPAGALNIGSVARVMKNMGLRHLVLVNPQCDLGSAEARQMAVKANDILEASEVVATLPEALIGCQRAIATTGADRRTALNVTLEHPRAALPWLLEGRSPTPIASALIFGREDRGLTKEELNYAQRFVQIPTSADYLSLNLAQAVAICCYELAGCVQVNQVDQSDQVDPQTVTHSLDLATLDQLEGYYHQLEALLLQIGYLHSHTAASRMEKIRRLYSRAQLSEAEVAMLRGVVSQMEWALKTSSRLSPSPSPDPQPPTAI